MFGMRETIRGAQEEFRDDVLAAGLGANLARAVRSEVYPQTGESMKPAGTVFAQPGRRGGRTAPAILGQYNRGTPITPALSGGLAIPTAKAPKHSRGRRYLSPAEAEAQLGIRLLRRRMKSGNSGLFRVRRVRGKQVLELWYVLVRSVPGKKRLNFDFIFRRWGGRLGELIAANFEYRG